MYVFFLITTIHKIVFLMFSILVSAISVPRGWWRDFTVGNYSNETRTIPAVNTRRSTTFVIKNPGRERISVSNIYIYI